MQHRILAAAELSGGEQKFLGSPQIRVVPGAKILHRVGYQHVRRKAHAFYRGTIYAAEVTDREAG